MFADVDGVSLYYECTRSPDRPGAPVLVLIHEMGGTLDSWNEFLEFAPPGIANLRYDVRGCGRSEKITRPVSYAQMSRDLKGLLAGLEITEPVVVMGSALGAGIGLDFILRYPDHARAVIAFAPAIEVDPSHIEMRRANADHIEQNGMRSVVDRILDQAYPEQLRTDANVFRTYRARLLANDSRSYAAWSRMLLDSDIVPRLPNLQCPSLFVAGDLDPARKPEAIEASITGVPGARFTRIASGHFMPVQTPKLAWDTVANFVRQAAGEL